MPPNYIYPAPLALNPLKTQDRNYAQPLAKLLFVPQRNQRINLRRAPRRNPTRQQRDERQ